MNPINDIILIGTTGCIYLYDGIGVNNAVIIAVENAEKDVENENNNIVLIILLLKIIKYKDNKNIIAVSIIKKDILISGKYLYKK